MYFCLEFRINVAVTGLNLHAGIEGFFCIIRNTPKYHMKPHWHFSSPKLEQYMHVAVHKKWDTSEVGACLEAFLLWLGVVWLVSTDYSIALSCTII